MVEQAILLKLSPQNLAENTTSRLRQEYQALQRLLHAQPASQQEFIRVQAASLAEAILNSASLVRFSLPDNVACLPLMDCAGSIEHIRPQDRPQHLGSLLDRLTHSNLISALDHRLTTLEKSTSQAVAVSASLIRFATAMHIIYQMLPSGNSVVYTTPADDDIPNRPVANKNVAEPGHFLYTRSQLEEDESSNGDGIVDQFDSYASSFFLPQYVDFDEQNHLLAGDLQSAIAHIQVMRRYLLALNSAVSLAPYMVVDEEFQARRYGILGQLVNQGRALAGYQVDRICQSMQRRAANHSLDRGVSLSLPFFNDQTLTVENYSFDLIPRGRVMFVPAFVVLAVRAEAKKILMNTQLSLSTRRSLIQELCIIERAFLR